MRSLLHERLARTSTSRRPARHIPVAVPTASARRSGYEPSTARASPRRWSPARPPGCGRPARARQHAGVRRHARVRAGHLAARLRPVLRLRAARHPAALDGPAPRRDPQEPNEDVDVRRAGRVPAPGAAPARRRRANGRRRSPRASTAARTRATSTGLGPRRQDARSRRSRVGGDVDLALWGPTTVSVLEPARRAERDSRGVSERPGQARAAARPEHEPRAAPTTTSRLLLGGRNANASRHAGRSRYALGSLVTRRSPLDTASRRAPTPRLAHADAHALDRRSARRAHRRRRPRAPRAG